MADVSRTFHVQDPGSSLSQPSAEPAFACGPSHATDPVDSCPPTTLDSQSVLSRRWYKYITKMRLSLKRNPYLWAKCNCAEMLRNFLCAGVAVESLLLLYGVLNEPDLVGGKKRNLLFSSPLSLKTCSVKPFFLPLDEIANNFYTISNTVSQ